MSLTLVINGQSREFADLVAPVMLDQVVRAMDLKGDRIAVEHNGEIAQRARWAEIPVTSGDRLEIVHFVGGGANRWVGGRVIRRQSMSWPSGRRGSRADEVGLRLAGKRAISGLNSSVRFTGDGDYT